jgi:hypothetical protein
MRGLLETLERGVGLGSPLVLLAEAAKDDEQDWEPESLEDPTN